MRGNVEDGVREMRQLLDDFNAIAMKFTEPMSDDEMNKLLDKQGRLQDQIDHLGAWELDHKLDIAMDALRLPPADAEVENLSGGERRRVALCRLLLEQPDMLLLDEPTNHLDAESVAWLEKYLESFPGTVVAITHDRYFLDNVAKWILELDRGAGIPWEGNYSGWLEQKQKRLAIEEKQASARQKTLAARAGVGPAQSPRPGRPRARRASQRYEELRAGVGTTERGLGRNPDPGARATGRRSGDRQEPEQGLRRPAAVRESQFRAAARRHRRRDRPQRRRQDHAVPHDRRPGTAGQRRTGGRQDRETGLRRPEPGFARRQQDRVRGNLRRPGRADLRHPQGQCPGLLRRVQLSRGPTSRRR